MHVFSVFVTREVFAAVFLSLPWLSWRIIQSKFWLAPQILCTSRLESYLYRVSHCQLILHLLIHFAMICVSRWRMKASHSVKCLTLMKLVFGGWRLHTLLCWLASELIYTCIKCTQLGLRATYQPSVCYYSHSASTDSGTLASVQYTYTYTYMYMYSSYMYMLHVQYTHQIFRRIRKVSVKLWGVLQQHVVHVHVVSL